MSCEYDGEIILSSFSSNGAWMTNFALRAELEQIREGVFILWVHTVLPYGCEYGENLIIIIVFLYFYRCARTLCIVYRSAVPHI